VRIGIDARYAFRTERRGIGEYVAALLAHLPAVADERDRFILYVDRRADTGAVAVRDARFTVRRLPAANMVLWEEVALPLAAARDRVDLLHLTSNYGPSLAPCPTVYTIHDLIEWIRPQLGPWRLPVRHRLGRAVRIRTLPRQVRRAGAVIAVSQASRDDLVRLLGLPADRVHVIPHGVGDDFVPAAAPGEVRRGLRLRGFAVPDRYVLALGALDPRKNGQFLMRAFEKVHARLPDVHLWIVGVERPEEYPVPFPSPPGWLTVLGYVEREVLVGLMQGAAAFVYPSLYEGFGLPVLQAMACGVPVLASNHPVHREVSGGAAVLFDPSDVDDLAGRLSALLSDEFLWRQCARAGLEVRNGFSWQATARRTYDVYRHAVRMGMLRGGQRAERPHPAQER
jgi:glycosyltransferase involved in cell wall biosynthesis